MADLCRQCTREIWGEDKSDFSFLESDLDHLDSSDLQKGIMVLCEGCGFVLVDSDGSCIDPYCKLHRGQNAN